MKRFISSATTLSIVSLLFLNSCANSVHMVNDDLYKLSTLKADKNEDPNDVTSYSHFKNKNQSLNEEEFNDNNNSFTNDFRRNSRFINRRNNRWGNNWNNNGWNNNNWNNNGWGNNGWDNNGWGNNGWGNNGWGNNGWNNGWNNSFWGGPSFYQPYGMMGFYDNFGYFHAVHPAYYNPYGFNNFGYNPYGYTQFGNQWGQNGGQWNQGNNGNASALANPGNVFVGARSSTNTFSGNRNTGGGKLRNSSSFPAEQSNTLRPSGAAQGRQIEPKVASSNRGDRGNLASPTVTMDGARPVIKTDQGSATKPAARGNSSRPMVIERENTNNGNAPTEANPSRGGTNTRENSRGTVSEPARGTSRPARTTEPSTRPERTATPARTATPERTATPAPSKPSGSSGGSSGTRSGSSGTTRGSSGGGRR